MLSVDLKNSSANTQKYAQGLAQAHDWLQNATGKGNDFVGWVNLPRDYDKEEFARIQAAAQKLQGPGGHRHRRQLPGGPGGH